ncbi:hypothetical protein A3B58_03440 [Candidatus Amesbacteria bacterium RIFCSPLOWO2_01_FULL_48_50]|nr:MAG: hypothetical protein A3B58_03440 [Candidatus Amesbacteria bacterium RIFCSPLOWO2_01_FULL_48_50]
MTNSQIKVEIQKSKTGFIGGVTVVLVVALAVRVIGLGKYPVSMGIDEIANAYNAYSLLTTGHDEWGKVLPVTLRSFNDYKPPVNIYLIVPSIAFFGKTEAAVRLPTAVLGALTAVVWAVWVRRWGMGRGVAIAAGLGLALSPWHINYSRATFEAVTALFLVLTGVTLFQRWEKGGGKAWAAGAAAMLGICSGTGSDGDTAYVSGDVYTGGGDAGGGHFLAEGKVIGEDIASGKLRKYLGTSVGQ